MAETNHLTPETKFSEDPIKFNEDPTKFGPKPSQFCDRKEFEKCTCVICQDLMKDPVLIDYADDKDSSVECGHIFCRECILKHYKSNPSCPICRKHIDKDHTFIRDIRMDREIGKLLVYCLYNDKKNACEWKGDLGREGKNYNDHISTCLKRGEECAKCKNIVEYSEVNIHTKKCLKELVTCTNSDNKGQVCDAKMFRGELDKHIESHCLYRIVECPFKFLELDVCQSINFGYQLDKHIAEYKDLHLHSLNDEYCNLQDVNDENEVEFKSMSTKINELNTEIKLMKKRIQDDEKNQQPFKKDLFLSVDVPLNFEAWGEQYIAMIDNNLSLKIYRTNRNPSFLNIVSVWIFNPIFQRYEYFNDSMHHRESEIIFNCSIYESICQYITLFEFKFQIQIYRLHSECQFLPDEKSKKRKTRDEITSSEH